MEYYEAMKNYLPNPWQNICYNVKCHDKKYIHDVINYLKTTKKETEKFQLYLHYFILENFLKCIAFIVRKYYVK